MAGVGGQAITCKRSDHRRKHALGKGGWVGKGGSRHCRCFDAPGVQCMAFLLAGGVSCLRSRPVASAHTLLAKQARE